MRRFFLLAIVISIQAFTGIVMAQERYGFEIGAYAGPTYWNERHFQVNAPQAIPPIDLGFKYDNKVDYGVRFNLLSRGFWGGELDYNFQKNTVTLTRASFSPASLDGNIQHFYYNTIFYPIRYSEGHVSPFLTAGIGLAAYSLSDEARARAANPNIYGIGNLTELDKRFAFNYGGGIKAIVAPHFGVRVDFRHNFSDVPSYGLPKESTNPAQTVLPIQGKLQNYEISAGVYFQVLR
jgi:opacity protein-like surface antigen